MRATPAKASEDEIDVDVCCMCFVRYEDDILAGSDAVDLLCMWEVAP